MNCEEVEQQDILDSYVAGKLADAERDRFEEHFFNCEQCLRRVEAARLARDVLIAGPTSTKAGTRWLIPVLGIAAGLITAIAIWQITAPKMQVAVSKPAVQVPAAPSYDLLARFDPPAYRASTLRGAAQSARAFRDAMKLYSANDFAGAAQGLRTAVSRGDATPEIRFYLGVSEMLSGEREGGIADLRKVIAAGDTPFLSEARFYLAKGLLAGGRVTDARDELQTLIKEQSELSPRAQELLAQLPKP